MSEAGKLPGGFPTATAWVAVGKPGRQTGTERISAPWEENYKSKKCFIAVESTTIKKGFIKKRQVVIQNLLKQQNAEKTLKSTAKSGAMPSPA